MAITVWLWMAAIAIAVFPTLTMHKALRLAIRASGEVQEQAKETARRAWWAVMGFTCLIAILGFRAEPALVSHFANYTWANAFPVLAMAGLMGVRLWDSKETESLTYVASAVYIVGMVSSTAVAVYPF
jgi:cytochrome bd-type quinol oxidase subunit 2